MFEFVNTDKLRDKLVISIVIIVFFAAMYKTADPADVPFPNETFGQTLTASAMVHLFRYDIAKFKNNAFMMSLAHSILVYTVILI